MKIEQLQLGHVLCLLWVGRGKCLDVVAFSYYHFSLENHRMVFVSYSNQEIEKEMIHYIHSFVYKCNGIRVA
jgi:hypothetical protein